MALYTCHVRITIRVKIGYGSRRRRRYALTLIASTKRGTSVEIHTGRQRIVELRLLRAGRTLLTSKRAHGPLQVEVTIAATAGTARTKTTTRLRLQPLSSGG